MYKLKTRPEDFVVKEELDPELDPEGEFAYFRVRKTGFTTEQIMQIIQRVCQIPARFLNYSGLKDKHAVTEQYFSVRQEFAGRIKPLNLKDIRFEYIGRGKERIALGSHKRNTFEITVRDISEAPNKARCIPNYYDEQRFSKNNADIGRLIIKKEFAAAAELLAQSEFEMERKVREALEKHPDNAVGALREIPRRILMLYVHAYQSFLYNKLLAKYVEQESTDYAIDHYSLGTFLFPRDEIHDARLPLIGFGSVDLDDAAKELLEAEGVITRDFIVRSIPELSSEGNFRSVVIGIKDLQIGELKPDEIHPGAKKCRISFSLPTGCYATIVVRALFS